MENVAPLSAGRELIFSIRLPTSLQSVPMARLLLHHTSQCILHSRRNVIIPGNLLKQQLPCRPKFPHSSYFLFYMFSKVCYKYHKLLGFAVRSPCGKPLIKKKAGAFPNHMPRPLGCSVFFSRRSRSGFPMRVGFSSNTINFLDLL